MATAKDHQACLDSVATREYYSTIVVQSGQLPDVLSFHRYYFESTCITTTRIPVKYSLRPFHLSDLQWDSIVSSLLLSKCYEQKTFNLSDLTLRKFLRINTYQILFRVFKSF